MTPKQNDTSGDSTDWVRRTSGAAPLGADTVAVDGSMIRCGPSSPLAWSAARLVGGEVVYRLAFGGVLAAEFATAHAVRMAAHPSQYRRAVSVPRGEV